MTKNMCVTMWISFSLCKEKRLKCKEKTPNTQVQSCHTSQLHAKIMNSETNISLD